MLPLYRLNREKTQPENMCDIVFEKVQDHAGKVNRTSVYAEAASEGFFKKGFMRNFPEFTKEKESVPESLS